MLKPQGFAVVGFAYGFAGSAYGLDHAKPSPPLPPLSKSLPPTVILLQKNTTTGHPKAHRPI